MKWTPEQHEVLTTRNSNLLVAAAAGSGKTAVLVERIVRLVMDPEQPADLDAILVVTFTQAAAMEMKERIRKAFSLLAMDGNARAREQLARVSTAPISTIHAFCLNVLREQFHQAGLEPGFRVGEQTECALLLAEALDQLMDDRYGQAALSPELADLLDCFAGYRDDHRLREEIVQLWRYSRTMPWPEEWLRDAVAKLKNASGDDFGRSEWGGVLVEEARWRLEEMIREMTRGCRLAEDCGFEAYAETFTEDLNYLNRLGEALVLGWDEALAILDNNRFKTMRRVSKDADPVIKERLLAVRRQMKEGVGKIRRELLTAPSSSLFSELRDQAGRMETLAGLAMGLDRFYARQKRRRNLVDFDDLEHLTLGLLLDREPEGMVPTPLAVSMRARWHAVMIDEYQDSNLVQEAILTAVATQTPAFGNLFMVGDVKQSIYRFRQAMPELFLSKYRLYSEAMAPAGTPEVMARKILLHRNFRSRPPVLEAVNRAFSRLMTPQLGEMAYTEEEALIPGAGFPPLTSPEGSSSGYPVTFCLLDASAGNAEVMMTEESLAEPPIAAGNSDGESTHAGGTENDFEAGEAPDSDGDGEADESELPEAIQQEAIWAAGTIRKLVEGTEDAPPYLVTEPNGSLRPIRYRDCAILLRATSQSAQIYVEEFALQGMPLFSDTGAGYFASVEVGVVLSFLQVLDNPRQDIPLAAVLRSPLYGWDETMLAQVRQAAPDADFLDAVMAHDGVCADACTQFLEDLDLWRERARMMPVSELLEYMYEKTGYALHVAGLPQGQRRTANLRLLVERAARFESAGFKGLFGFIRYVERLRLAKGDLDGAKIIGEGEDVVRLMSIHKSKGLEFPVVLLCGTGKRFNLMDRNRRLLMHHRYGLGPDAVLTESGAIWATAAKHALSAVSLREMLSEEMRILYVALTRARERLFVCGRVRKLEQMMAKAADLPETGVLSPGTVLPLRSHAHWLLYAWYPLFQDPNGPVRLVVPELDSLLAIRNTVLEARRTNTASVLTSVQDMSESAVVPEGQISLFDLPERTVVQSVLGRNLTEARRRLQWHPPFPKLSSLPSKLSVTALKRLWDEQDEASARLEEAFRIACTSPEEITALRGEAEACLPDESETHAAASLMEAAAEQTAEQTVVQTAEQTVVQTVAQTAEQTVEQAVAQTAPNMRTTGTAHSASEGQSGLEDEECVLPIFMRQAGTEQQKQAGLEYGTLMHLVLQHLDPVPNGLPDVEAIISALVARGQISPEKAHLPNRGMLRMFVHSELFARMSRAGKVYRETPFTILMPAAEVLRDTGIPANEQVVMQGIVDCWFVEDGQIVLVDYKTDRTLDRVPAYRRQLAWYAEALEKTTGFPVKERILWFLRPGIAV